MAGKQGGLWGAIKGAMIDEVPDAPKAAVPVPPPSPVAQAPAAGFAWPAPGAAYSGASGYTAPPVQADPKMLAKLEEKINAATPPVYAAFMAQFASLESVIPDEGVRFNAALKVSGATVEQLSGAIDSLIQVMGQANEEFTGRYNANKKSAEDTAAQQADADRKLIATCQEQAKSIQAQILALQTKIDTDAGQLRANATRFEGILQGFQAAYNVVVGRLRAQKEHITTKRV